MDIIINLILLIANIIFAVSNYYKKNYKLAMLSSFAVGVVFLALLYLLK